MNFKNIIKGILLCAACGNALHTQASCPQAQEKPAQVSPAADQVTEQK